MVSMNLLVILLMLLYWMCSEFLEYEQVFLRFRFHCCYHLFKCEGFHQVFCFLSGIILKFMRSILGLHMIVFDVTVDATVFGAHRASL